MQKNYKLLLLLYGLLCTFPLQAQNDSIHPLNEYIEDKAFILKYVPFTLFEYLSNTVELGLEYKFDKNKSFQTQIGFGTHHISPYGKANFNGYWTFRWRNEFRFYFKHAKPEKHPYWAIELAYKRAHFYDDGFLGRNCDNGDCEYSIWTPYQYKKNVIMLNFKLGRQKMYTKRFLLEAYYGIGFKYIFTKVPQLEKGDDRLDAGGGFNDVFVPLVFTLLDEGRTVAPGHFLVPNITLGLKLGTVLGKKM